MKAKLPATWLQVCKLQESLLRWYCHWGTEETRVFAPLLLETIDSSQQLDYGMFRLGDPIELGWEVDPKENTFTQKVEYKLPC